MSDKHKLSIKLRIRSEPEYAVLEMTGILSEKTSPRLEKAIAECDSRNITDIVIDFLGAEAPFSSSGMGFLIRYGDDRTRRVAIVGLSPGMLQLFQVLILDKILNIFGSVEEAAQWFETGEQEEGLPDINSIFPVIVHNEFFESFPLDHPAVGEDQHFLHRRLTDSLCVVYAEHESFRLSYLQRHHLDKIRNHPDGSPEFTEEHLFRFAISNLIDICASDSGWGFEMNHFEAQPKNIIWFSGDEHFVASQFLIPDFREFLVEEYGGKAVVAFPGRDRLMVFHESHFLEGNAAKPQLLVKTMFEDSQRPLGLECYSIVGEDLILFNP